MDTSSNDQVLSDIFEKSPLPSLETTSYANEESIFSSWAFWIFVIILLAFLGFNIFNYLAKGTQDVGDYVFPIWGKILTMFGYKVEEAGQEIMYHSATGLEAVAQTEATEPESPSSTSVPNMSPEPTESAPIDRTQDTALNQVTNYSKSQTSGEDYVANDSYTPGEALGGKNGPKAGWCYIGTDDGFRSCSKVGENDVCMSGDIFPTQDVCVNPSLRP